MEHSMWGLKILDVVLDILHAGLIVFTGVGWIFRQTRKWHLFTLGLILFSWIVLGFFYGWGYCIMTDWHWSIKTQLGESNLPASFISYCCQGFLNLHFSDSTINIIAVAWLAVSLALSLTLNLRKR